MVQPQADESVDPRPRPSADDATASFWAAASEHRFVVQRCRACRRLQYPPDVCCIHCQAESLDDVAVSGRGSVYSYAVAERALHAGFVDALPYVVVLVELEEQPGLRVLANLVGPGADGGLACGMPVVATFEARGGVTMPQFRLADAQP